MSLFLRFCPHTLALKNPKCEPNLSFPLLSERKNDSYQELRASCLSSLKAFSPSGVSAHSHIFHISLWHSTSSACVTGCAVTGGPPAHVNMWHSYLTLHTWARRQECSGNRRMCIPASGCRFSYLQPLGPSRRVQIPAGHKPNTHCVCVYIHSCHAFIALVHFTVLWFTVNNITSDQICKLTTQKRQKSEMIIKYRKVFGICASAALKLWLNLK